MFTLILLEFGFVFDLKFEAGIQENITKAMGI